MAEIIEFKEKLQTRERMLERLEDERQHTAAFGNSAIGSEIETTAAYRAKLKETPWDELYIDAY